MRGTFNLRKGLKIPFDEVVTKVQDALKEQGFGILTEINVKEVLKKKLDIDYPQYKILGACNPLLAKRVLDIDREVGTLLPCNVIIYESGDGVRVSIQRPMEMMKVLNNDKLTEVAKEVESRLQKVIDTI